MVEINCYNGLFNFFSRNIFFFFISWKTINNFAKKYSAFSFDVTNAFGDQTWVKWPPVVRDHFSRVPWVVS